MLSWRWYGLTKYQKELSMFNWSTVCSIEIIYIHSTPGLSKTESAQSLFTNKLKFQRREMTCLLSSVKFWKLTIDGSQFWFIPRQIRPKFQPIRAQCCYPHQTSSKQNGNLSQLTLSFLSRSVLFSSTWWREWRFLVYLI